MLIVEISVTVTFIAFKVRLVIKKNKHYSALMIINDILKLQFKNKFRESLFKQIDHM